MDLKSRFSETEISFIKDAIRTHQKKAYSVIVNQDYDLIKAIGVKMYLLFLAKNLNIDPGEFNHQSLYSAMRRYKIRISDFSPKEEAALLLKRTLEQSKNVSDHDSKKSVQGSFLQTP